MTAMEQTKLKDFRLLLLGDDTDSSADPLIELLYKMAVKRMLHVIGMVRKGFSLTEPNPTTVPPQIDWILDEALIRRFNRIGSEGYLSQSVEGHSVSFSTDDFTEFLSDIQAYYEPDAYTGGSGKVVYF